MCGIAGIHDPSGLGRDDARLVRRMCAELVHRGPDSEGYRCLPDGEPRVCLGVRRLAVIDPEGGDQPLLNEDGSVTAVFNGAIVNHLELRAELEGRGHRFRTGNDGETLVHLYEERGVELLSSLRGMYAFAIWDSPRERLVLAVDRVGIKPLYVVRRGARLLFASEVRALLAEPAVPRRLHRPAVDTYLRFGYAVGPDTLFEGIRRLPPGHAMVAEGDSCRLLRHHPGLDRPPGGPAPDRRTLVAEVGRRVRESVALHLRSDVPLGLFLSGGVDSGLLLAAMRAEGPGPVKTFTVGYRPRRGRLPRADETAAARRLAGHFGSDHRELVLSAGEWWSALPGYVRSHEEPNANPSMVSLHALSRLASREVKVVLNGTGGDELFGGYRSHRVHPRLLRILSAAQVLLPEPLRRWAAGRGWPRLEARLPGLRSRRIVGALPPLLCEARSVLLPREEALRRLASFDGWTFSDSLRRALYRPALLELCEQARHAETAFAEVLAGCENGDPADLVHRLAFATWLPGNGLLALDKVTMAHGLEARVPYFDPPLLALAARIPANLRARGDKRLLREAARQVLPEWAAARPKRPFETPIGPWLSHELAGPVREILLDPSALGRELFRPAALEGIVARHLAGDADHAELLLRLLVLELWQRQLVEQTGPGAAQRRPP